MHKWNAQRIAAVALIGAFVVLTVLGAYGYAQRGAESTTRLLDDMRLRALLVNTGEGATEAMIDVAKKEAQAKAKADGLSMAERREIVAKVEAEVRANAQNLSVDYATVDEAPILAAAAALQEAQEARQMMRDGELDAYKAELIALGVMEESVPDDTALPDAESDAALETAPVTQKIDLSGFVESEALQALGAVVDERYAALGAELTKVYPMLDQKSLVTLKDTLLSINYAAGDTFESRYDRLVAYNDGNLGFSVRVMRSARDLILLGAGLLMFALVVLFYQPIVKKLGMPRLIITMFLLVLCLGSVALNLNFKTLLSDTIVRVGMNAVLVLAMLPGIQCGIALNLGLPLGIIGGLLGNLICIELGLTGWVGFVFAVVVAIVMASVLGYLYSLLLNRLKGNEMAVTTYVGFSIVSVMCIAWLILPFYSPVMRWPLGTGLRVTINMKASFRYLLNDFLEFSVFGVTIPTGLLLFTALMCLLVWLFCRSRTGIAMQAVGNNPRFAEATGVSVDKMRIVGTTLSTVLAAIGIIVYSQSYGFMQLYNAPRQMAFVAAAAILIGGASTSRAKISNVIMGTILFQGVVTISMPVFNQLLPQSTISETMRILISNGIILYALTKSGGKS